MKGVFLLAVLLLIQGAQAAGLPIKEKQIVRKTARADVQVVYPRTGHAPIDIQVSKWAEEMAANFQGDDSDDAEAGLPWSLEVGYTVARNDAAGFALEFGISDYSGGAHPNSTITTFNFLMPEGEPLDIEQVLEGRKGLNKLSALVVADLKKQLLPEEASNAEWIENGASAEWANFQAFLLLPDTLRIAFSPYAVAPYSSGPQTVDIPLKALADVLRKNPRTPLPSFDCSKAASVIEHSICASMQLARLDRQVAAAYRMRLRLAGEDNQSLFKQAQRAWVGQRNAICGQRQAAALTQCLVSSYQARLTELQQ